jgi:hypothetical protein
VDQIDLGALDALICQAACMRHEAHLPFAALVRLQARADGVYYPVKQKCLALVVAIKSARVWENCFYDPAD